MNHTQPLTAFAVTALLLIGPGMAISARAQASTIQISDAWARRASSGQGDAMGHGGSDKGGMGSMSKDMGSMGKSGDKGAMAMGHGGSTSAIYMIIVNSGSQADALVSAASEAAQTTELHEVENDGGVMKMRPVPNIPIPSGGKVELRPGSYHVMLLGLKHDLKPGDKVPVTLTFERGGAMSVDAVVK